MAESERQGRPTWVSGRAVSLIRGDAVLCSGTLRASLPFRERVAAARAGGFAGISLWARDYQVALEEGLGVGDIRLLLDDHGLSVGELDPAWWWLPGASDIDIPAEHDAERIFAFGEHAFFEIAEHVGARSLNAVDVFGGSWSIDAATASFAALCDRAAAHGLLVHLEFLPWSRIPDLATAWQVVRAADRPNGGLMLDAWHYFRSNPDRALLRSIPGSSILGIQLCDAPGVPEANQLHATLHERLLPGDGDLALTTLLADLDATGTNAPIGVEVFSDALHALAPEEAGRVAGASLCRLVSAT
jgi:sugar phosphate isomerase/epimerase